ncbi:rootletin isoform 2-T2 [Macrochelys suwanniensis]
MSAPERAADAELKLEAVIQKLESSVLTSGEGKSLTIRGSSEDAPPTRLPARIREIVAENLSAQESPACPGEMSSLLSLQEENRILQQELSRVEDLLAQSRAERDELAIKYNAISERLEESLRLKGTDPVTNADVGILPREAVAGWKGMNPVQQMGSERTPVTLGASKYSTPPHSPGQLGCTARHAAEPLSEWSN